MYVDAATRQKLKDKYGEEMVFAVPSFAMVHIPDGFSEHTETTETLKQYDNLGKYILRYDAEMNNAFQQLIPYVVVKNANEDKYFVAERIAQGDDRLARKLSCGFGGHIDSSDGHQDVILNALRRELDEELDITLVGTPRLVGTIRQLSSETADHTGFVFEAEASHAEIKEIEKLRGVWMTPQELIENYFSFEGWSKLIIDEVFTKVELKEVSYTE